MTGGENGMNPVAPPVIETAGKKNCEETVPVDRVEGFAEIDFEYQGRNFPSVTSTHEVSCVDDVLGDTAAREEAGLVRVDKRMNKALETGAQSLRDGFHDAVLERYRAKVGRAASGLELG